MWEVVEKPNDKNIIRSKWVFDVKNDAEGKITRLKARLVAIQEKGFDYIETFSPTILDYITVGEWSTEINALKDLIKWLEMDNEKLESQLQPNIRNPNNS